jgi:membrane-bound metal-dependent hydrolase YbcI (DUF457 family)
MRFWKHAAIAFAAAFVAAALAEKAFALSIYSDLRLLAQIAAVTLLGAALPDADLPKTRQFRLVAVFVVIAAFALARDFIASRFPQLSALEAAAYALAAAFAALGVIYVAKPRHRGVTHSLAALAVVALGIFVLTQSALLAGFAALAFASHLACDGEVKLF